MNRRCVYFLVILFSGLLSAQESREIDYIRTFAKLAVEEMELYRIPASITLAQGILETGGGQSRLADVAKNHFGIKCKNEWTGPTISHTDDAPNECFRVYESPQESYRDHSKFLAERPYYKDLFKLDLYDYNSWAYGLKKAGYATNSKYPQLLISKIEKYNLNQFDRLTTDQVDEKLIELYGPSDIVALSNYQKFNELETIENEKPITSIQKSDAKTEIEIEFKTRAQNPSQRIKKHKSGLKYVIAKEGEDFGSLAKLYKMDVKKLASYNELPVSGKLRQGQFVFFDKKKNKGVTDFYTVIQGDDMYLIAQKNGIRISKLYDLNRMKPGDQPKPGTILNLKKKRRN